MEVASIKNDEINSNSPGYLEFVWHDGSTQVEGSRFACYGKPGQSYLLKPDELLAVVSGCPFGRFPGLPTETLGLMVWNGQFVEVLDLTFLLGPFYKQRIEEAGKRGRIFFVVFSDPVRQRLCGLALNAPLVSVRGTPGQGATLLSTAEIMKRVANVNMEVKHVAA